MSYCYYLEYSDYLSHLYCYTHNISADICFDFLKVFHIELEISVWFGFGFFV